MTEPTRAGQAELPSDAELIQGLRTGDEESLQLLLDAYWGPVVRYADRVLAGAGDPQDVAQDAFVRVWERRESWSVEGSVRGLIYTIARNAALDELRRRSRGDAAAGAASDPESPPTPEDDARGAELRRAAAAAVSDLPPQRQEVFRLAREHGLSHREIADMLDLSPQTVSNHMSLALSDLRQALRPYLTDATGPDLA